ncbi:MAG TPA: thiamine phosphate synthase [Micropepsaceae bacterium]|nr:thiamine phosphate synthase [Micropepsaceae bacterium]
MAWRQLNASQGRLPRLFAPTDPARGRDPPWLAANLPPGSVIIFRHYELSREKRLALAQATIRIARPRHVCVLVARDVDVAIASRADGFHAPEALAHRILSFRAARPDGFCTMAAHGPKGLIAAARYGADTVLLSLAFASQSHAGAMALGPVRISALAAQSRVPVIALGGITRANVARLSGAAISGIAVIGGIEDFI